MPRTRFARPLRLLVLALLLAAAPAAARPPQNPVRLPDALLLGWLRQLWEEIGCGLDPNGMCSASPNAQAPARETGDGLEPRGRFSTERWLDR